MIDGHQSNPIRRIAHDAATDAVPMPLTDGRRDFESWSAVVDELAEDTERQIRAAVGVDV